MLTRYILNLRDTLLDGLRLDTVTTETRLLISSSQMPTSSQLRFPFEVSTLQAFID